MTNIQVFNFKSNNVRVEMMKGEPLFCLPDVADALQIKNANPSRFNMNSDGIHKMYSVDSLGRKQEITFINEPNLYRIIFRSNKKEAVEFQNWVFEDVLPSIRKNGSYTLTINAEQQRAIQEAVNRAVRRVDGRTHQGMYSELKSRYHIAKYDQLPVSKFKECINWLDDGMQSSIETKKPFDMMPHQEVSQIVNYVDELRKEIKRLGGNMPNYPDVDSDSIAHAVITRMIQGKQVLINFGYNDDHHIKFMPDNHWVITEDNIAGIVGDPDGVSKKNLPNIMNAIMKRIGLIN